MVQGGGQFSDSEASAWHHISVPYARGFSLSQPLVNM